MIRKNSPLLQLLLALLIAFAVFVAMLSSLASFATGERMMLSKMQAHAHTAASGVDASNYPALAQAITGYLRGKLPTAQVEVHAAAGDRPAFSESELLHLQDVRGLVLLVSPLRIAAVVLTAGSLLYYALARKWRPRWLWPVNLNRALNLAAWLLLVPLLALGLWAVLDFKGCFHALHRLLFTNDLWLLDPTKDLLLQLMPLPFFVSYALEFLKQHIFLLLAVPLAAFGLRPDKKNDKAAST